MKQPTVSFRILILRIAAGATFLFGASAFAADPKPELEIKTKALDVTITLDDKIKAEPALAADLLAEGKRYAEKQRKDAEADRRSDPKMFPADGYMFQRDYTTRSTVGGRYVSIVRSDYIDVHAAHPNTDVNTILWDKTENKRISIRPFFKETADKGPMLTSVLKNIIVALRAEKKRRDVDEAAQGVDWYKDLAPNLLKIGAVSLAPSTEVGKSSGLTFHYPPYAVGPYAEGPYTAFVPWQDLKPYLTAEGEAIFGGARPKGDDDEQQ
jgi:hypothetical protein